MIADISDVCACCGLLILFGASTFLTKVHPKFVSVIEVAVKVENDFNCCGRIDNGSHFYKSYYNMIDKKKIPKFVYDNCINVSHYQKYSDVFSDLTPVEEEFIACANSVISIMKFRLSGSGSLTCYYWIQSHTVVLPQNPKPLFIILLSSILAPHNVICIAWASKQPYKYFNISLFPYVWRIKIWKALCWLKANNPLYTNIVINLDLLNT